MKDFRWMACSAATSVLIREVGYPCDMAMVSVHQGEESVCPWRHQGLSNRTQVQGIRMVRDKKAVCGEQGHTYPKDPDGGLHGSDRTKNTRNAERLNRRWKREDGGGAMWMEK
jgi:hypothetical protein